jgi:YhcH/YjgK/YiaL family protein
MIIDRIENNALYPFGKLWDAAFAFLKTVTPETACGRYELDGDNLFVIIDSYETKSRDAAKLETHRKYVDIQAMISGKETHEVFPKKELTVSTPYSPEKDAQFYQIPETARTCINLRPGDFAVYFSQDAHLPCLTTGGTPQPVRKAVVKIAVDLLNKG